MKPHLCFIVTSPATALTFLSGYLQQAVDNGWRVSLICSPHDDLGSFAQVQGADYFPVKMAREPKPGRDIMSFVHLLRQMLRIRPDVLVYATPKASLLGALSGAFARIPVRIYEQWGLRLEGTWGTKRLVLSVLERITIGASTNVVANSDSLADAIIRLSLNGGKQIHTLGAGSSHGVDLVRYSTSASTPPVDKSTQKFLASTQGITIGFVGRLNPDKGLDVLLEALSTLHDQELKYRCIIVGGSDGENVLEGLATESGLPVHLVGAVSDPRPYYKRIDVLVLPSKREGFPNVVLEAAAFNVPSVVSSATGCVDSVIDNRTGLIFRVGDAAQLAEQLYRISSDPKTRKIMGNAARRRVEEKFPQNIVRQRHLEFFAESLNNSTKVGRQ